MRMRISVHLGAHGHPGRSCDFVNQLARETQKLSRSFARNGSQEKTLRIESPLSEKHSWTTATLESNSFAVTRPQHVSLLFDLILPRRHFQVAYFSLPGGVGHDHVQALRNLIKCQNFATSAFFGWTMVN